MLKFIRIPLPFSLSAPSPCCILHYGSLEHSEDEDICGKTVWRPMVCEGSYGSLCFLSTLQPDVHTPGSSQTQPVWNLRFRHQASAHRRRMLSLLHMEDCRDVEVSRISTESVYELLAADSDVTYKAESPSIHFAMFVVCSLHSGRQI